MLKFTPIPSYRRNRYEVSESGKVLGHLWPRFMHTVWHPDTDLRNAFGISQKITICEKFFKIKRLLNHMHQNSVSFANLPDHEQRENIILIQEHLDAQEENVRFLKSHNKVVFHPVAGQISTFHQNMDYQILYQGKQVGKLMCQNHIKSEHRAPMWKFCNKLKERFGLETRSEFPLYLLFQAKNVVRYMLSRQIVIDPKQNAWHQLCDIDHEVSKLDPKRRWHWHI